MVGRKHPMATERSRRVLTPGKIFAGKFLLEENFAAGSMGSVWRARDTERDVPVAIKVMTASLSDSPGFVARFEREASAASQIGSPNVVSIFEYGVHINQPYIVMELLRGEDLHERFKRVTRLSVRASSRLVRGICEGLHAAHESGIIHRDLKPANIYLVREGDSEFVKLLDFGIAKVAHDESTGLTATGQMIGTAYYMSPEQIQGAKTVDARCDVWAAAVIAYRALTGQLPFSGHTVQVIRAILHDDPPRPSTIAVDLSGEIDAFFARALARDIDERFQTARDLANALQDIARREPRESGAEPSPLSLGPATRSSPKPPASWKRAPTPAPAVQSKPAGMNDDSQDSAEEGDPGDKPPSSTSARPPVPVDAQLLPVHIGSGDPASSRDTGAPLPSVPSTVPPGPAVPSTRPAGAGSTWVVWLIAALLVIGTAVGVALAAMRH
jgi:eukaryotic-like serine/threonine-protein kinase